MGQAQARRWLRAVLCCAVLCCVVHCCCAGCAVLSSSPTPQATHVVYSNYRPPSPLRPASQPASQLHTATRPRLAALRAGNSNMPAVFLPFPHTPCTMMPCYRKSITQSSFSFHGVHSACVCMYVRMCVDVGLLMLLLISRAEPRQIAAQPSPAQPLLSPPLRAMFQSSI